jgi:hypothetical protein
MSRPDDKKNVLALVRAFGEDPTLRELANLVLVLGNRDSIDALPAPSARVLVQVLKLIDAHDLYGSVAYPKHHTQADVSDIYLYAFQTRGVFVNVALQEPFGLTVIEAAAHGVPTVATRNGGPVDIMAALHHGVVVEPTDSKAIAAALLDILTDPAKWDAMSAAGSKNIVKYSWPAHAKRWALFLGEERHFERAASRRERTMSGILEKSVSRLDLAALDADGGPAAPSAADVAAMMSRGFSTPPPAASGAGTPLTAASGAATPHAGRRGSGFCLDDLAVLKSVHAEAAARAADFEAAAGRRRLVAVNLDSGAAAPAAAAALRAAAAALTAAGVGDDVGLGVLSMLGFESTREALAAGGADPAALDFVVANAGADVWTRRAGGQWEADEAYESLIESRWDRAALRRALRKVVSAPEGADRRLPRLKELLYCVGEAPEEGVHPRHVCVELDAETQSILAAGMGPRGRTTGTVALAAAVTERLRRRLRAKGLRAQHTLQLVPRGAGEDYLAVLHLTPIRASRALALRHLARRLGLGPDDFAVAALAPELVALGADSGDGGAVVGPYVSDLVDLVGGAQRVFVLPRVEGAPAAPAEHGGHLAASPLGVPLAPFDGCARVAVVEDAAALGAALAADAERALASSSSAAAC